MWAAPTATFCNTLHTAPHCNALQHTAMHCNTLQRPATHCNTLQHTATHCNTLQHIEKWSRYTLVCHHPPFQPQPTPPHTHTQQTIIQMLWGLQIIGLFCKRALRKRRYSAKKTYNFKEPIHRSHSIPLATQMKPMNESCLTYERLMSHI